MIEYTITEVLATACSLTLGTDIWAGPLPEDVSTGVSVTVLQDRDTRLGILGETRLAVYVVKTDYFSARALASLIIDKLNDQVALDSWMASDVHAFYKGVNLMNNHMFVVFTTIRKE